jgi:DNA-binding NarL/FixJ family response regulator
MTCGRGRRWEESWKMAVKEQNIATNRKRKVFLVDDHPLLRQGLRQLIDAETDIMACGDAANIADALAGVAETQPDLVISDLTLVDEDGMQLVRQLRERYPRLKILVLSMHDEGLYAERAIAAGSQGYIMKQEACDDMLNAMRQVLAGGIYLSHGMKARAQKKSSST